MHHQLLLINMVHPFNSDHLPMHGHPTRSLQPPLSVGDFILLNPICNHSYISSSSSTMPIYAYPSADTFPPQLTKTGSMMRSPIDYIYADNEDHDLHKVRNCSKIISITLLLTDYVVWDLLICEAKPQIPETCVLQHMQTYMHTFVKKTFRYGLQVYFYSASRGTWSMTDPL